MRVTLSKNLNKQLLFSIIILVCLVIITHLPIKGKQVPLRRNLEDFPTVIGQWRQHTGDNEIVSASKEEGSYVTREYIDHSGRIISFYTHYIEKQTQGRETTINIRYYLPELSGLWQVIEEKIDLLEIPGHTKINVNRCIVENGSRKRMILYWYQVGGTYTANIYRAKILSTLYAIFRNRRDGAFIYLSTPVTHSVNESREALKDFGRLAIPILTEYLPD